MVETASPIRDNGDVSIKAVVPICPPDECRYKKTSRFHERLMFSKWCQRADLNCRPKAYESSALPLSYSGVRFERMLRKGEFAPMSSLGDALFCKIWILDVTALLRHLPATLSELRRTCRNTSVLPVILGRTDNNVLIGYCSNSHVSDILDSKFCRTCLGLCFSIFNSTQTRSCFRFLKLSRSASLPAL